MGVAGVSTPPVTKTAIVAMLVMPYLFHSQVRSGTLRSGSVDRPVMGASSAGSSEVTPPGRSRAFDAAHRADGSIQRQQPTRQACGESDPMGDATPILTGLRTPWGATRAGQSAGAPRVLVSRPVCHRGDHRKHIE
jgi:hypothetical protein